jgi:hypothetical protein
MFYEGDLQSGIAAALEQSRAVLCFVHGAIAFRFLSRYEANQRSQTMEKTVERGSISSYGMTRHV